MYLAIWSMVEIPVLIVAYVNNGSKYWDMYLFLTFFLR